MKMKAGETAEYLITYLEMDARPSFPRPPMPTGKPMVLIHAETPPVWYFLNLYEVVGRDHEWKDMHAKPAEALRAYVQDDRMELFTLFRTGWPAGFFMLDRREVGCCDLAYLGLVPEAIGLGLGKYMLQTAIHTGWDHSDTERMTVQTCTLDHPRALQLYQKSGFTPFKQERKTRILSRDMDVPEI